MSILQRRSRSRSKPPRRRCLKSAPNRVTTDHGDQERDRHSSSRRRARNKEAVRPIHGSIAIQKKEFLRRGLFAAVPLVRASWVGDIVRRTVGVSPNIPACYKQRNTAPPRKRKAQFYAAVWRAHI